MNIPQIISYDICQVKTEKPNVVPWELDESRCVLLIHDMQEYFLRNLSPEIKRNLVRNCYSLLLKARKKDIPVIYTAQCGDMTKRQRGLLMDFWGPGMSSSNDNIQIVDPIQPLKGEMVSPKWRYSAFTKTNLLHKLVKMRKDQIIICGVYAHIGIQATAVEAYSNDIEVFLAKDAVADFSSYHHSMAMDYMSQCCSKNLTVSEIL
ncbi:MAG: isochorismatase family protein [Aliivibrio sp.]|uniref:isochorismatase family protein n=1 Tax=Aliivibrio sp. TaxID=1872443 RepID=UPI001A40FF08|nr:isochorismatase family protein [Aliivibrio sp.]